MSTDASAPPPPPDRTPDPASPSNVRFYQRSWVHMAAVGVIALGVGIGVGVATSGSPAVENSPAYQSLQSELRDAEAQASLVDQVDSREAALNEREDALDARDAEYEANLADIEEREKAVGIVEKEVAANTVDGDGMYEAGKDIKPGRYKTEGQSGCYYAVLRDTSGSLDSIVTNGNINGSGYVSVSKGQYLEVARCAEWVLQ